MFTQTNPDMRLKVNKKLTSGFTMKAKGKTQNKAKEYGNKGKTVLLNKTGKKRAPKRHSTTIVGLVKDKKQDKIH